MIMTCVHFKKHDIMTANLVPQDIGQKLHHYKVLLFSSFLSFSYFLSLSLSLSSSQNPWPQRVDLSAFTLSWLFGNEPLKDLTMERKRVEEFEESLR